MRIISVGKDGFDKITPKVVKGLMERGISIKLDRENESLEYGCDDPYIELKAKDVLTAVVLGIKEQRFQDAALSLFSDSFVLKIVDLSEVLGSKEDIHRVLSRIIGTNGKTKRIMEEITETNITISDNKILIIGMPEGVGLASDAINAIIRGSPHKKVYRLLEAGRRKIKEARMKLWND